MSLLIRHLPMSQPNEASSWWSRDCGGRDVLIVAYPLVLSSLSWTLLTFIDRIMLTWWSQDALAAAFPAALLWWTSVCLPLGACMYVGTFISQYEGAGRRRQIGSVVWQGVWIAVISTPLLLLAMPLAPWIFQAAGHAPKVVAVERKGSLTLKTKAGSGLKAGIILVRSGNQRSTPSYIIYCRIFYRR